MTELRNADNGVMDGQLSNEQAAVYDRQIRVWGLEAQKKMSTSRFLVIGCSGVVAETCKNIVLAGVRSVTLLDDSPVTAEAAVYNFLITPDMIDSGATLASASAKSLAEFNPMVKVGTCTGRLEDQADDFLDSFDAVLLGRAGIIVQEAVNAACRTHRKVAFFSVECRGRYAYMFADLQHHRYTPQGQNKEPVDVDFPSLAEMLATPWSKLPKRRFCNLFYAFRVLQEFEKREARACGGVNQEDTAAVMALAESMADAAGVPGSSIPREALQHMVEAGRSELPAVCAIVGGILGQELLKYVSSRGAPHKNLVFFDVESGEGVIEEVPPAQAIAVATSAPILAC